ncbi:MAG: hypothetical protein SO016_12400 [Lachnospiraceae bacterium]|nr:hypothetical protein [Robinsoniella sp.]MDY3767467.1 hypothetical protein [Lachnospiraceae bacterium]
MKKMYEAIWEIFNQCPNNQMRDIFIDELEIEDVDQFVREKFKGKDVTFDRTDLEDGTIIYDIVASGIKQRYSFTEI